MFQVAPDITPKKLTREEQDPLVQVKEMEAVLG